MYIHTHRPRRRGQDDRCAAADAGRPRRRTRRTNGGREGRTARTPKQIRRPELTGPAASSRPKVRRKQSWRSSATRDNYRGNNRVRYSPSCLAIGVFPSFFGRIDFCPTDRFSVSPTAGPGKSSPTPPAPLPPPTSRRRPTKSFCAFKISASDSASAYFLHETAIAHMGARLHA